MQPGEHFGRHGVNYWNEPDDLKINLRGHREGAKYITTGLLERGGAMPYNALEQVEEA